MEKVIHNDGRRIKQLLYNFINNQLRFEGEGTIQIYVQSESFMSDSLQLSVVDQRKGIPKQATDQLTYS